METVFWLAAISSGLWCLILGCILGSGAFAYLKHKSLARAERVMDVASTAFSRLGQLFFLGSVILWIVYFAMKLAS